MNNNVIDLSKLSRQQRRQELRNQGNNLDGIFKQISMDMSNCYFLVDVLLCMMLEKGYTMEDFEAARVKVEEKMKAQAEEMAKESN